MKIHPTYTFSGNSTQRHGLERLVNQALEALEQELAKLDLEKSQDQNEWKEYVAIPFIKRFFTRSPTMSSSDTETHYWQSIVLDRYKLINRIKTAIEIGAVEICIDDETMKYLKYWSEKH